MRLLAIACLVAACGGGAASVTKAKPVGPAIDEKTAEKDARGLATEIIDMLGKPNKDSLLGLLDPTMFVFGPRRGDAFNRADAVVELGKRKLALRSGKLDVVASPGGRSAWVHDTLTIDGQPHAVTAILTNTSDIWQVEAAIIAPTPTRFAIKAELSKDAVVPVGAVAKGKIDSNANGAVERYRKGLIDQDMWGSDLSARDEAIVIGPAAGEVTRGKKDIKALWKTRLETKTRAAASGDIVAQVTDDGQLAWVSSPITQVSDKGEPLPMRAFAVFEKSGDEWKLILLHESLVIDAAGSGTAFKKILPPAPKDEPKVAAAVEKKDDDKKAKKKQVEDEKAKAKKGDDKKKVKKAKDDDEEEEEEEEKPAAKKDDKKKAAADKKKAEQEKKAADKKVAAEKKRAAEDKKAADKKVAAEKKKAAEDKKAADKKAAADKKKKAKKTADDDDDEDEKPKKVTKKDPKAKKDVDPDKEYERYPGKKKPKRTEEEDYEARKKARKKAEEDEKAKAKRKAAEKAKKAKKKVADDEEEEDDEDEKPKKKKKQPVEEEDEDRVIAD